MVTLSTILGTVIACIGLHLSGSWYDLGHFRWIRVVGHARIVRTRSPNAAQEPVDSAGEIPETMAISALPAIRVKPSDDAG
ncbi:hypothetical protein FRB98_005054, partial [Tulasnella sp. 332]